MYGTARHTAYGYSLYEFEVYSAADAPILGMWEAQSLTGTGNNPLAAALGSSGSN